MRRAVCVFCILFLLLPLGGCTDRAAPPTVTLSPTAQPTAVPTAPKPESASVSETAAPVLPQSEKLELALVLNGRDASPFLTDGRTLTTAHFSMQDSLTVKSVSGEEIAFLYFIWDAYPGEIELLTAEGQRQSVPGDMLHKLVRLDAPSVSVTVTRLSGEADQPLCDLSSYSFGSLPKEVQDWQYMPEGEADLMLFPAHADDEYVFFGGIIPYYAGELGYKVQLCWMTYHKDEFVRNHELLNALWKGGCVYYPVINFASRDVKINSVETAMLYYPFESWESFQVEQLRKYKPLVAIGHDEQGEYGHGAHILASRTLEQAVADAADSRKFPDSAERYGIWDTPKTYIHLFGDEPTYLDFTLPLKAFGGRNLREVALDCYREHDSQIRSSIYTVYDRGTAYDASRFGLLRSLVGKDSENNDLLEHLDPTAPRSVAAMPDPTAVRGTAVADADGLRHMADDPHGVYTLTADIDLSGADWLPFAFYGELDGNGHSITDLRVRSCGAETSVTVDGNLKEYESYGAGLFSYAEGAYIHDLTLQSVDIRIESGEHCFAAGFAGCFADSRFENCSVEGRVELISSGTMVGVGGIAGFGRGEFDCCRSDMTLIHRDRNLAAHCEQFTGGIFACGHSAVTDCSVTIRGYTSCHGYVHDGGLVGMEYQYYDQSNHLIRYYTGNTVSGFIEFFEQNHDRRAYCEAFVGENLGWAVNYADGNSSSFERRERFVYDTELLPEDHA